MPVCAQGNPGQTQPDPMIIYMAGYHCLNTPPGCCLEKGQTGFVQDKISPSSLHSEKKGRITMLQTLHLEQPENYNSCYDRSPHSCKSLWKNPEGLLPCDYREMLINIKKLIFFLIKVAKIKPDRLYFSSTTSLRRYRSEE